MPLTLFNSLTLFLLALTLWMAVARFRFRAASRWFLLYYVFLLAFSRAFEYSLNTWWLCLGVACGLALRFAPGWTVVRAAELAFFGYVLWRGLGLVLGW